MSGDLEGDLGRAEEVHLGGDNSPWWSNLTPNVYVADDGDINYLINFLRKYAPGVRFYDNLPPVRLSFLLRENLMSVIVLYSFKMRLPSLAF